MANLAQTIKEYKELQEQIKIIVQNQKDLTKEMNKTSDYRSIQKLKKELKEQEIAFKDVQKQIEDTADILSNEMGGSFYVIQESSNGVRNELKSLERQMRELALAGQQNTIEYKEMQANALELGRIIRETSNDIDSGAITLGGQFKQLGLAMASLDFNSIISRANNLSTTLGSMSFSTVIEGVNGARVAFANLGKTLLKNPLFIIGSVIIALGSAIYKLMKETGLLEVAMGSLGKAFDLIMKPLNLLITAMKSLTDAIGLTNNAEKKLADDRLKRLQDEEDINGRYINGYNTRLNASISANELELESLRQRGLLTVEEERRIQTQINHDRQKIADNNLSIAKDEYATAQAELDKFRADHKRTLDKLSDDDKKTYNDLLNTVSNISNDITTLEQEVVNVRQKGSNDLYAITLREIEQREKEQKDRIDKEKEYRDLRLKIARELEDIEIDNIGDDFEKQIKKAKTDFERYKEDTMANRDILEEEKKALIKAKEEELSIILVEIAKKRDLKAKQNRMIELKEYDMAINRMRELTTQQLERSNEDLSANIKENKDKYIENLIQIYNARYRANKESLEEEMRQVEENLELDASVRQDLLDELQKELDRITLEHTQVRVKAENDANEIIAKNEREEFEERIDNLNKLQSDIAKSIQVGKAGYESLGFDLLEGFNNTFAEINEILDTEFENSTDKALAFASSALGALSSIIQSISNELNRQLMDDIQNLNKSYEERLGNIQNQLDNGLINQIQYNDEINKIKTKQAKEQYKLEKEAFESKKKGDIANATISMLQGAVMAYSGAQSIPIVGPAIGAILAGIVTAAGMANISRIKNTQFSGTSGGGNSSMSSGSMTNIDTVPKAPQFVFEGQQNDANEVTMNDSVAEKNINVTTTVSAVEIQSVLDSNNESDYFGTLVNE